MRKPSMIVRKEFISQLDLNALQQINGQIADGRMKIERIVSMQEIIIDNRFEAIVIFYAV